MRINFKDYFDGYCQKRYGILQEQIMEKIIPQLIKKGKICQTKGSTNLVEAYIRKYSSLLEFYLCLFATAIREKEIGKKTKMDDDADQVTIKTREK